MSLLKHFCSDIRGNISIACAFAALPFIAVAGLAVDYTRASNTHNELQQIADAAALAAASAASQSTLDERRVIALDFISSNERVVTSTVIDGKSVIVGPNTVDVSLTATVEGTLVRVMKEERSGERVEDSMRESDEQSAPLDPDLKVKAHTKAAYGRDSYLCLLALNRHEFESVRFYGDSDFMAEVCTVHANSDNLTAMRTMGSAYAQAEDFCAVGGWAGSGFEPDPTRGCNVKRDPYAGLPMPPVGPCKSPNPSPINNATVTLTPGTYCGGLEIKGHSVVTLEPGIYVIKDGELRVRVHSSLSGSGVTFYLVGNSSLNIESQASVNLTAPTTGTWASMAIMQAMDSNPGVTNMITSGGDVNITGAYYTPAQHLTVWANGDMNTSSPYFPMVVDTFEMSGNATLYVKLDWEAAGLPAPTALKRPSYVLLTQ